MPLSEKENVGLRVKPAYLVWLLYGCHDGCRMSKVAGSAV